MPLVLDPKSRETGICYFREFSPGDDFYELLIDRHRGSTDEQSLNLDARLILLSANHIGDIDALRQAMIIARSGV